MADNKPSAPTNNATVAQAGKSSGSPTSKASGSQATSSSSSNSSGFKQSLSVFDMVVYGLIFMVPIAPFAIYGGVANASGGMAATSYLIAAVAMIFTVFSFGVMIRTFPSSGSIYTYTTKSIGKGIGFIAGWLMLLQYLSTPDMVFLIAAEPLNNYVPAIPVWGWCLIFLFVVLFIATRGIQTTMIVNRIALVLEFIVLAMFFFFCVRYVILHPSETSFSLTAFFNPKTFNFGGVMSGVSLAVFSFVGFGCVATLTQEAKDERFGPSRAMLIMVIILAVLFAATCYLATCVDPTNSICEKNSDNGFYLIAELVGGKWFGVVCAVAVALAQGFFTGLVSQVSVSRIMYVMGKSGSLPKPLAKMDPKTGVPIVATIFCSVVSLVALPLFLNIGMDDVGKIVNFGALATYFLLNLCVIVLFWFKKKDHGNPMRYLICPIIGALITGAIFISIDHVAQIIGFIWIAIGIAYYLYMTKVKHKDIKIE